MYLVYIFKNQMYYLVFSQFLLFVTTLLRMMGVRVSGEELAAIMDDIDVDKSGQLEFEEFVILSARLFYTKRNLKLLKNIIFY